MSWFTPILLTTDERQRAQYPDFGGEKRSHSHVERGANLGSAMASGHWSWASVPTSTAQRWVAPSARALELARSGSRVTAPVDLLARMSDAARILGRSESDVWVEAAREWLRRREGAQGAPPAAPAYASAPAPRRATRAWDDIDALMLNLRAPARPISSHEGAPAA